MGRATSNVPETVLATPGHGYLVDPSAPDGRQPDALFATANGAAGAHTARLTLVAGSHHTTSSALRRAGGQVIVSGRLTPAPGPAGATLTLSHRRPDAEWHTRPVIVGSNGAYRATISGVRATTDVVADAVGNGTRDGAAAYQRIVVSH